MMFDGSVLAGIFIGRVASSGADFNIDLWNPTTPPFAIFTILCMFAIPCIVPNHRERQGSLVPSSYEDPPWTDNLQLRIWTFVQPPHFNQKPTACPCG
jgi:hypothetical protein